MSVVAYYQDKLLINNLITIALSKVTGIWNVWGLTVLYLPYKFLWSSICTEIIITSMT